MRWNDPVWLLRREVPAAGAYTVRVERAGAERDLTLSAPLARPEGRVGSLVSTLVVGIAFLASATAMGLLKPEERIVRLAFVSSMVQSLVMLTNALDLVTSSMARAELAVAFAVGASIPVHLALSYHFNYRFPPGVRRGRFWSALFWAIYAWALALWLPFRVVHALELWSPDAALAFVDAHAGAITGIWKAYDLFVLLELVATVAVITRNYRQVTHPDQRRRIRWIIYGLVSGTVPWLLIGFARVGLAPAALTGMWMYRLANLALLAIPITTAYAVVKHRVFGSRVVVRRGVQDLFAKNVLRALLLLPVAGLAYSIAANPQLTFAEVFLSNSVYLYLLIATAVSFAFRNQLRAWVDRRFFREAYNREQVLVRLIEEIKTADSMSEVARLVSSEVDRALHPTGFFVCLRDSERRDFELSYSSSGVDRQVRVPYDSPLLSLVESGEGSVDGETLRGAELPDDEREWLELLGVDLVVAMKGSGERLVGLLMLGERKSEEPFTHNDRRLLRAVAAQLAMAYENVVLKQQVEREKKYRRDVLSHVEGPAANLVRECAECGRCYDGATPVCERDGAELEISLPVERTLDGKYRLDRRIGSGGMGAVYEGTDLRLSRQVAVKVVVGGEAGKSVNLKRFEREARASAQLAHPNIVTVFDYGAAGDEGAYLVMELLAGVTLRDEMRRLGRVPPDVAAEWFEGVFDGMRTAHAAGVVHRDLKPENILIAEAADGKKVVKILDFGLAKVHFQGAPAAENLTVPGVMMGTFGYMPPEQLLGEEVDVRSDVFSLGVIVAEALTGKPPFDTKGWGALLMSIYRGGFRIESDLPEVARVSEILARALANDRAARYATVDEFQRDLIPALRACPPF
jgi:hypothetical protein